MPIAYELSKLLIAGFRGVPELEIEFPSNAPLALIGGNNCGKSTVLNAIAFALEGPKFHGYDVDEFDFFRNSAGQARDHFSIDIDFSAERAEHLPAVRGIESPIPLYGCRAVGRRKRGGLLESRVELFGKDRKAATYSPRTPLRGDAKEKWGDHDINYRKYTARWKDVPECRPEVWHLMPDNLYAQLYTWRTGPLQRLSNWLAESFFREKWKFKHNGQERDMPDAMHAAHKFFSEAVTNFPLWKDDLRPRFEATLSSYVGRQAGLDLRPQIQAIKDWLAQQIALSFSTDAGGASTPLSCMGHGWQSLIRMAALEVLSQIPEQVRERVVLLIEEPETYLHPHLSRRFRRVLNSLAAQGWVVVLSTHSPYLFRFDGDELVVRLRREGDKVSTGTAAASDVSDLFRVQAKLDERGTHEFVFAQKVVLCEGKDDVYALKLYLSKLGVDLDTLGITVVDAGGVQNLPDFASLASKLVIPWIAITDADTTATGTNPKTERARKKLCETQTGRDAQVKWELRLEHCLNTNDASPDWQAANIEPLALEDIRKRHPLYASTAEAVACFLGIDSRTTGSNNR